MYCTDNGLIQCVMKRVVLYCTNNLPDVRCNMSLLRPKNLEYGFGVLKQLSGVAVSEWL